MQQDRGGDTDDKVSVELDGMIRLERL